MIGCGGLSLAWGRSWAYHYGQLARFGRPCFKTVCLQSTFIVSVTVAGLGLNVFTVDPNRPLSGLVVVRFGGQAADCCTDDHKVPFGETLTQKPAQC